VDAFLDLATASFVSHMKSGAIVLGLLRRLHAELHFPTHGTVRPQVSVALCQAILQCLQRHVDNSFIVGTGLELLGPYCGQLDIGSCLADHKDVIALCLRAHGGSVPAQKCGLRILLAVFQCNDADVARLRELANTAVSVHPSDVELNQICRIAARLTGDRRLLVRLAQLEGASRGGAV
jgi:hypothetical protein